MSDALAASTAGGDIVQPPRALSDALMPADPDYVMRLVNRAEQALGELTKEHPAWMAEETDRLLFARERYVGNPADAAGRQELYRAIHDIRANAGGFGYPFAARIAANLSRLLDEAAGVTVFIVDRHVAAIRAIVREKARGDHNAQARALAEELERVGRDILRGRPLSQP